ncbi:MAG: alpha-mannosidase [Candidatus Bipolaricaulia bacterium]
MFELGARSEIVVIAHTHWDREWYLTFQQYRYHLVELIDRLLDILKRDDRYTYFLLDGQSIVLEDYLAIRPENESHLKQEIARGRIGVGPWYVLPDEFLVSGEAIIRNLMLGIRIAERFGQVMKHGYLPDPFGHIAQMPQILKGFDIETAFLERGIDERVERSEFYWEAPDGSRMLTHFLLSGYCNAAVLKPDPDEIEIPSVPEPVRKRVADELGISVQMVKSMENFTGLRFSMRSRASTSVLLLMNGCDHLGPQSDLTEAIEGLNEKTGDTFIHGTLTDFIDRVRASNPDLKTVRGELHSSRYYPVLSGILSSRTYLKQMNVRVQTLLEGYAEPLTAIARALELGYQPAPFLREAWRLLLQNHPHDSICGTSIDPVHEEMIPRFHQAEQIAEQVADEALRAIATSVNLKADDEEIPILIFNPSSWRRTNQVKVEVEPALTRNLPYGRRSLVDRELTETIDLRDYRLQNAKGWTVPFRITGERLVSEDILNGVKHVPKVEIRFRAEDLPPFGYQIYRLVPGVPGVPPDEPEPERIAVGDRTLENEFYQVAVADDGSLTVVDKESGTIYEGVHTFESSGDAGDTYNYSPPEAQTIVTSQGEKATVKLIEDGPDQARILIENILSIPKGLTRDRKRRSGRKLRHPISTVVSLSRGGRRIEFNTTVDNQAQDHRLRVVFPTGIRTTEAIAEDTFAVVRRPTKPPNRAGWVETPSPTQPQQRFVAIEDGRRGVVILNRGLAEYEATEDGTLYLTLLRCVGWLSRDDMTTRLGHAGPGYPTPDAQCLGRQRFEYAIVPYSGGWEAARIWQEAIDFNTPVCGTRVLPSPSPGRENLTEETSFLRVEPEALIVSAFKPAESDDGLIVRLYNITDRSVAGHLELYRPIQGAWETDLNEQIREELPVEAGSRIPLTVGSGQIKTVKLALV